MSIVFPDYVHNIETAKDYVANDYEPGPDKYIVWDELSKTGKHIAFDQNYNNILENEDMLNLQVTAMTREFSIVAHAVAEIAGVDLDNDFGLAQRASGGKFPVIDSSSKQKRMNRRWAKLIDPMFYLASYCLMSRKNLTTINIWL